VEQLIKPHYSRTGYEHIFASLRQDVNKMVRHSTPNYRLVIVFKAFLFPVLYILTYISALLWGKSVIILDGCYCLLGFLLVIIFLNTIHDAVHDTVFKSKRLNNLYVYFFDLMGANSFIWRLRHVRFHHNYPNVNGWDTDIEQSSIFRVFPDGAYSKMHKFQHIYLPLLYPFYLANWLLVRDFKDFFDKTKPVRKLVTIPRIEYYKLFLFKTLFLLYLVLVPKILLGISWLTILGAFAIMLFTASCFSLLILLSPHANTESEFPLPSKDNELPHDWMTHMMITTNDITNDNWFTRFFMGCFNYHIVHHLFPNIHHVFYPEITKLLKEYSRKYNLPYREYSLWRSLKNHYRLLKQNRMPEDIFEEAM
jgi:linoleoyl-CoA desaturase